MEDQGPGTLRASLPSSGRHGLGTDRGVKKAGSRGPVLGGGAQMPESFPYLCARRFLRERGDGCVSWETGDAPWVPLSLEGWM